MMRWVFLGCFIGWALGAASANLAAAEVVFRVDFENGLHALGAERPLPEGTAGGGYEIDPESARRLFGVALDRVLAVEGQVCGRLGGGLAWHNPAWSDLLNCRLGFWILPMAWPEAGKADIVWGGDLAKPYQTLTITVDAQGRIAANHRSFQKQSEMLTGVTARIPLRLRQWNHVAYVWDEQIGQRLFVNGEEAGRSEDRYPASWCFDLRFGGGIPAYWDEIALERTREAPVVALPATVWRPTTPFLQRVADVETAAQELVRQAPPGSDARLRGRVILAVLPQLWAGAFGEQPTAHAVEDLQWIEQALRETPPGLRPGEQAVPPFDARKPVTVRHGRLEQDGAPVFLFGFYSPTAVDREVPFNLHNGLLPGPNYAMPGPAALGDTGSGQGERLREAQNQQNECLDLLVSVGSLPGWANEADPAIRQSGAGAWAMNIEAPLTETLYHQTFHLFMSRLVGRSTNLLLNLANEPAYQGNSPLTTPWPWRMWLLREHGSIAALNRRYGTAYRDVAAVETPPYLPPEALPCDDETALRLTPTDPREKPRWYDWCRFNQRRLDEWFRRRRDTVKAYRPETLVHVKFLSNYPTWPHSLFYALDPTGVCRLSDLNGGDAWTTYAGHDPDAELALEFASTWSHYDLMRSICPDKPVVNSENHLLWSGSLKGAGYLNADLPWGFYYAVLWGQALHGQCAAEFWTYWEGGKGYNLHERAQALDALARCTRDLWRYREEVTALAAVPPRVGIVVSNAALAWEPQLHSAAQRQLYTALTGQGIPLGYLTEDMLEDGALERYRLVFLPHVQHLARPLFDALVAFSQKADRHVAVIGPGPTADAYGEALPAWPSAWRVLPPPETVRAEQARMGSLLDEYGLGSEVRLTCDGRRPYGVEWRSTQGAGRRVVSLCNYSREALSLQAVCEGKPLQGVDLLTGRQVGPSLQLGCLQTMLIAVEAPPGPK